MIDLLPPHAVHELKKSLTPKRYEHSLGVLQTAFQLADSWKNHPVDRLSLAWASLFHDCGKEIPKEERRHFSNNGSIQYGEELLSIGKLNHAPLGAWLLQSHHGISDRDILMAVAYHPTGHPLLTPIGWLVYIADFLEPGRTYFPNRLQYLQEACADPLAGLKRVTQLRVEAVLNKEKPIHPLTQQFKEMLDNRDSI